MKRTTVLWILGIVLAFGSGCLVGTWRLAGADDTTYVLTEDLDLGASYAHEVDPPVSGVLKAGSEFKVVMRYGYVCYVEINTVLTEMKIKEVARPVSDGS